MDRIVEALFKAARHEFARGAHQINVWSDTDQIGYVLERGQRGMEAETRRIVGLLTHDGTKREGIYAATPRQDREGRTCFNSSEVACTSC